MCACVRACVPLILRCLWCITECYGCANFAREFQCTGFGAKLLDKPSQATFAVWELVTADATAVRQTAVLLAALNVHSTFFMFLHFIWLVAQCITFWSSVDINQTCQIQTVLLDLMLARNSDGTRRQMAQVAPTVHPQYDISSSIHLRFYANLLSWTSLATE